MTYEVPIVQVSRSARGRRPGLVIGTLGIIVTVAAIARLDSPASGSPPEAATGLTAIVDGTAATDPAHAPASTPRPPTPPVVIREPQLFPLNIARPLPTAIDCHDVAASDCHRIVRAALRILPDETPDVAGADVWRSLVCGDTFDCPPDFLRNSAPMGSVILKFDDEPGVAVNVVDWQYGANVRLGLRAWLTRSVPARG
ncbi:MAG TPA: hypothetical protein VFV72_09935 [Candidatus Limnocylindrales bacterium]|nr:hypothetical protein [Candidatus Limnocylindrales bacterium]